MIAGLQTSVFRKMSSILENACGKNLLYEVFSV